MRRRYRLRLRGAALSQADGQIDHRRHGQELAPPVLERLEPEPRAREVVGEADGREVRRFPGVTLTDARTTLSDLYGSLAQNG